MGNGYLTYTIENSKERKTYTGVTKYSIIKGKKRSEKYFQNICRNIMVKKFKEYKTNEDIKNNRFSDFSCSIKENWDLVEYKVFNSRVKAFNYRDMLFDKYNNEYNKYYTFEEEIDSTKDFLYYELCSVYILYQLIEDCIMNPFIKDYTYLSYYVNLVQKLRELIVNFDRKFDISMRDKLEKCINGILEKFDDIVLFYRNQFENELNDRSKDQIPEELYLKSSDYSACILKHTLDYYDRDKYSYFIVLDSVRTSPNIISDGAVVSTLKEDSIFLESSIENGKLLAIKGNYIIDDNNIVLDDCNNDCIVEYDISFLKEPFKVVKPSL